MYQSRSRVATNSAGSMDVVASAARATTSTSNQVWQAARDVTCMVDRHTKLSHTWITAKVYGLTLAVVTHSASHLLKAPMNELVGVGFSSGRDA